MRNYKIDRSCLVFRVARWFIKYRNRVLLFYLWVTLSINSLFTLTWMRHYDSRYLSWGGFLLFLAIGVIEGADFRKESSRNWIVVVQFIVHFCLGLLLSNFICHSFIVITIVEEMAILVVYLVSRFLIRS